MVYTGEIGAWVTAGVGGGEWCLIPIIIPGQGGKRQRHRARGGGLDTSEPCREARSGRHRQRTHRSPSSLPFPFGSRSISPPIGWSYYGETPCWPAMACRWAPPATPRLGATSPSKERSGTPGGILRRGPGPRGRARWRRALEIPWAASSSTSRVSATCMERPMRTASDTHPVPGASA